MSRTGSLLLPACSRAMPCQPACAACHPPCAGAARLLVWRTQKCLAQAEPVILNPPFRWGEQHSNSVVMDSTPPCTFAGGAACTDGAGGAGAAHCAAHAAGIHPARCALPGALRVRRCWLLCCCRLAAACTYALRMSECMGVMGHRSSDVHETTGKAVGELAKPFLSPTPLAPCTIARPSLCSSSLGDEVAERTRSAEEARRRRPDRCGCARSCLAARMLL